MYYKPIETSVSSSNNDFLSSPFDIQMIHWQREVNTIQILYNRNPLGIKLTLINWLCVLTWPSAELLIACKWHAIHIHYSHNLWKKKLNVWLICWQKLYLKTIETFKFQLRNVGFTTEHRPSSCNCAHLTGVHFAHNKMAKEAKTIEVPFTVHCWFHLVAYIVSTILTKWSTNETHLDFHFLTTHAHTRTCTHTK